MHDFCKTIHGSPFSMRINSSSPSLSKLELTIQLPVHSGPCNLQTTQILMWKFWLSLSSLKAENSKSGTWFPLREVSMCRMVAFSPHLSWHVFSSSTCGTQISAEKWYIVYFVFNHTHTCYHIVIQRASAENLTAAAPPFYSRTAKSTLGTPCIPFSYCSHTDTCLELSHQFAPLPPRSVKLPSLLTCQSKQGFTFIPQQGSMKRVYIKGSIEEGVYRVARSQVLSFKFSKYKKIIQYRSPYIAFWAIGFLLWLCSRWFTWVSLVFRWIWGSHHLLDYGMDSHHCPLLSNSCSILLPSAH